MNTLLHMTVSASALIAATALLRALFIHRLPKRTFTALWMIAALRLLLPVSLPVPIPVPAASVPAAVTATAVYTAPAADTAQTSSSTPVMEAVAEDTAAGTGGLSLMPFLALLWSGGAALTALAVLVRHLRALRRYREAVPPANPVIGRILADTPCHRRVRAGVCQPLATPLTYGVFRPVILLPKALEHAPEAQLRYILTHELCHIRRMHIPYKYLLAAALCLHWFNPLAWVLYALANRDLELSCDEAVLRRLDSERRDYALTLIALAQRRSFVPLASGFAASAVKERITNIMKYKKVKAASVIAAVVLVTCACTVFASAYTVTSSGTPRAGTAAGESAKADGPIQYVCEEAYYTPEEFEAEMAAERRSVEAEVEAGTLDRAAADSMLAFIDECITAMRNGRRFEKHMPVYYADGTPVLNSKGNQLLAQASEIAKCNAELAYRYYHPVEATTVVQEDTIAEEFLTAAIETGVAIDKDADVCWYTYEEYKDYVNSQKALYKEMEGEFFFNSFDGWKEWTAADTAEASALLDENLAAVQKGASIGYTPDGAFIMQGYPGEVGTETDYSISTGDAVIAAEAVATTVEGGTFDADFLKDYFPFGIKANSGKEWFEYNGKPIAGFTDSTRHLLTDGMAAKAGGIYVSAQRDSRGNLTGVTEISAEEFSEITGLTLTDPNSSTMPNPVEGLGYSLQSALRWFGAIFRASDTAA